MAARWTPRDLLDVDPDKSGFTCVGTTKKGERCGQSAISTASLNKARNILNELETMDFYRRGFMARISPKLDVLAEMTLCPRWHRDDKYGNCQRSQVHRKWLKIVSKWRGNMIDRRILGSVPSLEQPLSLSLTMPSTSSRSFRASSTSIPIIQPLTGLRTTTPYLPSPPPTPQNLVPSLPASSRASINNINLSQQSYATDSLTAPSFQPVRIQVTSTAHSNAALSTTTELEPPVTRPRMLVSSPSSSIRSIDPPTPSSLSPELSSPPRSPTIHSTYSASSSTEQSSRRLSRSRTPSPPRNFANSLDTTLIATLPGISTSTSTGISSTSSSTHSSSLSSRSQASTSPPLVNTLATAVATSTPALTNELRTHNNLELGTSILQTAPSTHGAGGRHRSRSSRSSTTSSPSETLNVTSPPPQSSQPTVTASVASPPTLARQATLTPDPAPPVPKGVVRKPLIEPCYVCTVPIARASDAVWCRATCGQNIHTECFETWAATQDRGGEDIKCGYCRALWV